MKVLTLVLDQPSPPAWGSALAYMLAALALGSFLPLMKKAAVEAVDRVFRPGFKYSKAEVLLVNLSQKGQYTEDFFAISQPVATENVMGLLDAINGRWGRGTMRLASVPTNPEWDAREMMSQSLTTRVDQLWNVYCK